MSKHRKSGQLRTFIARLSKSTLDGERLYHVHINVVGPNSRRQGSINPSSFAWTLPESLAQSLHNALAGALRDAGALGDEDGEHDDREEITVLPGEDDVS